MNLRILYVSTIGCTMDFFKLLISDLIEDGNVVDIATNDSDSKVDECFVKLGCKIFHLSTSRSPFCLGNIKAISEITKIAESYDIVHCHTPIASAITRVACRNLRKKGVKVFYTAHGFHFYKGAPLKNWLFYYPIEKICSRWTDVLITITKEDYRFARRNLDTAVIQYLPGVGVDTKKIIDVSVNKEKKREEIGVPDFAIMVLSVGELNENKNHKVVVEALSRLKDLPCYYVIAGEGNQRDKLERLAKKVGVNLCLLGYRKDVYELYKIADLYVLPSIREGLNVSMMEAITAGCPVITSNIRGCRDLLNEECLFDPKNVDSVVNAIISRKTQQVDINLFDYLSINNKLKEMYYRQYE